MKLTVCRNARATIGHTLTSFLAQDYRHPGIG